MLLLWMGGRLTVWSRMGKIVNADSYQQAIEKVKVSKMAQINQNMAQFKLLRETPQNDKTFPEWWLKIEE